MPIAPKRQPAAPVTETSTRTTAYVKPATLTMMLVELQGVPGLDIVGVVDGQRKQTRGLQRLEFRPEVAGDPTCERSALFAANLCRAVRELAEEMVSAYPVESEPGVYQLINDDLHGSFASRVNIETLECSCADYGTRGRYAVPPCPCHHSCVLLLLQKRGELPPHPTISVPPRKRSTATVTMRPDLDFA